AETRVDESEREAKLAIAEIGMGDGEIAGRQPLRQGQSQASDLQRISGAVKLQRLVGDADPQRHRDAEADILLKASRAREALRRMNDLRKTSLARTDAGPDLAAARGILGHR